MVTAIAHSNIALSKYWGKRQLALNLPAVGSISLTLSDLYTETSVTPGAMDEVFVDGRAAGLAFSSRVLRFLDRLRDEAGTAQPLAVRTRNTFPTGAGLASSASGFAALTLAASRALGMNLDQRTLSIFARQGSGSASRSIFGGFVEWHRGVKADGSDSFAEPIATPDHWDVRMLVVITSEHEKAQSSTDGMNLTRDTSPYYQAWVDHSQTALDAMRKSILDRDFTRTGELMEASCLQMHAVMLSGTPGLLYWNPTTVALINAVRTLRRDGTECYFTIDAGPQVKVLCRAGDASGLERRLGSVPGVIRVLSAAPGPAARVQGDP
ncbi:MAG: diphosphomevalonate decarboxylase [Myxococcota bacterium]